MNVLLWMIFHDHPCARRSCLCWQSVWGSTWRITISSCAWRSPPTLGRQRTRNRLISSWFPKGYWLPPLIYWWVPVTGPSSTSAFRTVCDVIAINWTDFYMQLGSASKPLTPSIQENSATMFLNNHLCQVVCCVWLCYMWLDASWSAWMIKGYQRWWLRFEISLGKYPNHGSPQNHLIERPEMNHEPEQRFCSGGEFWPRSN